jgi:hypothetical protein
MSGSSTLSMDPIGQAGPMSIVKKIVDIANDPRLEPKLLGIEQEPTGPCYHVQVVVTPEVVLDNLSLSNQAFGHGTLDLWIYQDSLRVERLEFHGTDPHAGASGLRLVLTNYNQVGPITGPPKEQFEIPALQSIGQ